MWSVVDGRAYSRSVRSKCFQICHQVPHRSTASIWLTYNRYAKIVYFYVIAWNFCKSHKSFQKSIQVKVWLGLGSESMGTYCILSISDDTIALKWKKRLVWWLYSKKQKWKIKPDRVSNSYTSPHPHQNIKL